jgi:2-polyprenyl-6-methoxyphenol hydroxylase-like FAD-dependent oxidoreductase
MTHQRADVCVVGGGPAGLLLGLLHAGFQCLMGTRVTELVEESGTVVGVRGRRHGAEPFEIRADVVVGADGRHSTIRRLGGFATEYEHHDFDLIWFVVDPAPDWPKTVYFSVGAVPLLMLPKRLQRRLFFGAPLPALDPGFSFRS